MVYIILVFFLEHPVQLSVAPGSPGNEDRGYRRRKKGLPEIGNKGVELVKGRGKCASLAFERIGIRMKS